MNGYFIALAIQGLSLIFICATLIICFSSNVEKKHKFILGFFLIAFLFICAIDILSTYNIYKINSTESCMAIKTSNSVQKSSNESVANSTLYDIPKIEMMESVHYARIVSRHPTYFIWTSLSKLLVYLLPLAYLRYSLRQKKALSH